MLAQLNQLVQNKAGSKKPKGSNSNSKGNKKNTSNKKKGNSKKKQKGLFKPPPFADAPGKLGDTKEHDGNTYYYCPADHHYGHWVLHKSEKCKLKDKKDDNKPNGDKPKDTDKCVVVDPNKLRAAFGALAESNGQDADEFCNAFMAAVGLQQE